MADLCQDQHVVGHSLNIVSRHLGSWLPECSLFLQPYTPYEGLNLANEKSRKLGVFGRKLEGSHSRCYHYFDKY